MYQVSERFLESRNIRPYRAYLTGASGQRLTLDTVEYTAGASGGVFALGQASAASFTATATGGAALKKGEQVTLSFALVYASGPMELVPMGKFILTKAEQDTDGQKRTLAGTDAMGTVLEQEFVCETVPATASELLADIGSQSGLKLSGAELVPEAAVSLKTDTNGGTGRTMRELVQAVALLSGANACMDRTGAIRLNRLTETDEQLTPEEYYEGELQVEAQDFTLGVLSVAQTVTVQGGEGQEEREEVFSAQTTGATRGIRCKGEWFTQAVFDGVWSVWQGCAFRPGTVKCLGDVRLELGDRLTATDRAGKTYSLPVLALRHSFDGGITTTITAAAPAGDGVSAVRQSVSQAVDGVKTELGRFRRLYADELAATHAELKHITAEDIVGEHGTINLAKGTFQFGDALSWDGSTLSVQGTLNSDQGNIGGWDIQKDRLRTTQGSKSYSGGTLTGEYRISAELTPPSEGIAPGVTISASGWDSDGNWNGAGGLAAVLIDTDDPTKGLRGAELYFSNGSNYSYIRAKGTGVECSLLANLPKVDGAAIAAGTDLNDLTDRGKYYVSSDSVAATLLHRPTNDSGTLYCLYPLDPTAERLTGWGYLVQVYLSYQAEVFLRAVNRNGTTGAVSYGAWRKLSGVEV